MDARELRQRQMIADKHRRFLTAMEPIIRAKCEILNYAMPSYCMYPDGKVERLDDGLSDTAKEALRRLDELCDFTAATFGFKYQEVDGARYLSYVGPLDL